MKRQIAGSLIAVLLAVAPVVAHHAAAGIDRSKTVTIEGTVKQFRWANPHAWMEIEVPNTKNGTDLWNFEMTSPAILVKAGWKSTSLKSGDKVKVTGRPFRNGDPGGLFMSITLSDGKTLTEQA